MASLNLPLIDPSALCGLRTAFVNRYEHNFGHGQNHLAELLFCLNLLAYLFHTTRDLVHITYQQVRSMLVTRQTFFNDVRALTRYLWFESWQTLFKFMLSEGKAPDGVNSS